MNSVRKDEPHACFGRTLRSQAGKVLAASGCLRAFGNISQWASAARSPQSQEARTAGITRARVAQILNLAGLTPDIQQAILDLKPTTDHIPRFSECEVRTIAILPTWEKQRGLWKRLVKRTS